MRLNLSVVFRPASICLASLCSLPHPPKLYRECIPIQLVITTMLHLEDRNYTLGRALRASRSGSFLT
jgi:hypothetical protein